jgi:hypothetical protein
VKTIYRATLETRHFHFEAFDVTPEAARATLGLGLDKHGFSNNLPLGWQNEFAGDIRIDQFAFGQCYRDRERL